MPERIATAGLGEWELGRRQASEYDPALAATTDPFAKPHYEQRHWHLHRNGRFDVVGRSPLDPDPDGGAQAARVRQFSPYGRPIGEAFVDTSSGAAAPVGDALTPAEIDGQPANIFSRRRIWERGLTGKPWDPELGLYWFGYRWYSPTLRRWTQQEPLGLDGPNLYHYVFGEPTNALDYWGLWRLSIHNETLGNPIDPNTEARVKAALEHALKRLYHILQEIVEGNLECKELKDYLDKYGLRIEDILALWQRSARAEIKIVLKTVPRDGSASQYTNGAAPFRPPYHRLTFYEAAEPKLTRGRAGIDAFIDNLIWETGNALIPNADPNDSDVNDRGHGGKGLADAWKACACRYDTKLPRDFQYPEGRSPVWVTP